MDPTLEYCRRNFKYVVPLPAINQVMTVCKILEGILPKESVRGAPPPDKKLLEYHFVFACVWAFGGCMLVDKVYDYRTQFSKWWVLLCVCVPFASVHTLLPVGLALPQRVQLWQHLQHLFPVVSVLMEVWNGNRAPQTQTPTPFSSSALAQVDRRVEECAVSREGPGLRLLCGRDPVPDGALGGEGAWQ